MIQLTAGDWLVIALYGVGMFAIAFWAFPKVKDCGSFFVGSRRMGKLMMVAAAFAGGTNANHPMAVAAASFQRGMSGVWLSLTWVLITPFFWMFPPAIRRLRIVTVVDIVRMRFGGGMATLFKLVSLVAVPVGMGLGIKSAAVLLEVMSGGAIAGSWALAAVCIPTIAYTLLGGVIAAYATDVFQGLLILLLSFMLIPFAIHRAGSVQALDAAIDDEFTSLFSGAGADFGFWWVVWFAIGITCAATVSAASGAAAARDEMTSRMKLFGLVLKRFCTVGWGLVGVLAIALYAGHPLLTPGSGIPNASPDNVFALAAGDLLPVGLRGLMVASILAAVMSSLDASILTFSSMAVNNVYQEHWVRGASASHYLWVARLLAVVGLLLGWWVATGVNDLVEFATIAEALNAITGTSILAALLWRRVTGAAALASVLVTAPLFLAVNRPDWGIGDGTLFGLLHLESIAHAIAGLYQLDLRDPALGFVDATGQLIRLPVQVKYPMFLLPSIGVLVGISLLTRQHNQRAVDEFYCRLDTPVGYEQRIRDAGFSVDQLELLSADQSDNRKVTQPPNARLLLVDILYLPGKLRRGEVRLADYKWDWIGLAGSIVFVGLFLWGVNLLGQFL